MIKSLVKVMMTLSAVGALSLLTLPLPAAAQDQHPDRNHHTNTSTRYHEDRGRANGHYRDQDHGRANGHYRDHDNRGNAYGTARVPDDRHRQNRDDRRRHDNDGH